LLACVGHRALKTGHVRPGRQTDEEAGVGEPDAHRVRLIGGDGHAFVDQRLIEDGRHDVLGAPKGLEAFDPREDLGDDRDDLDARLMPGPRFRIFSREFKEAAVRRIPAGEKIRAVADDLKLHRQLLYPWLDYYQRGGPDALVPRGRPWKAVALARRQALGQAPSRRPRSRADTKKKEPAPDPRLADLERKVGQQALELDFFREALRRVKEPPRPSGGRGATASSRSSTR